MRSLEESLFWEIFYRHQAVRSEMARLFDVSAATMSRSAAVLLAKHLIIESGGTSSSRGRRPALLQVNPALAHVAGIEIDRDRITAVITDMTGNLIGRSAVAATGDPSPVLRDDLTRTGGPGGAFPQGRRSDWLRAAGVCGRGGGADPESPLRTAFLISPCNEFLLYPLKIRSGQPSNKLSCFGAEP
jgi:hypothetical protein